jgi:hypothetical protein
VINDLYSYWAEAPLAHELIAAQIGFKSSQQPEKPQSLGELAGLAGVSVARNKTNA